MAEQTTEDGAALVAAAEAAQQEEAAPATRRGVRTTQPGCHVVLRTLRGGASKLHKLGTAAGKDVFVGNCKVPAACLLGLPYGATLRLVDRKWVRHRRCSFAEAEPEATDAAGEDSGHVAQESTADDAVRAAIAAASASFSEKTKFAQQKYLRKKEAVYVQQVTVLQPTMMELCAYFMERSRQKACCLRFDYLSAMLCQADVRTGGRYLVYDASPGLLLAGVAQRLAGSGRVFRVFRGGASDAAVEALDLPAEVRATVRRMPLDVLLRGAERWEQDWLRAPTAEYAKEWPERAEKMLAKRSLQRDLETNKTDAIIVIPGDDHNAIEDMLALVPEFLIPGGRIVIYGQDLQPLATLQGEMRRQYVDVRMVQLFTREFQVLPRRTHPVMDASINICEGFLLAASMVTGGDAGASDARGDEKRRRVGDREEGPPAS